MGEGFHGMDGKCGSWLLRKMHDIHSMACHALHLLVKAASPKHEPEQTPKYRYTGMAALLPPRDLLSMRWALE